MDDRIAETEDIWMIAETGKIWMIELLKQEMYR